MTSWHVSEGSDFATGNVKRCHVLKCAIHAIAIHIDLAGVAL